MRLTILGCAGSMPGPDAACSCYLVEADGFQLLLDCGTGALGALQRHGSLFTVDAIVLSHLHPDHCVDVASYVVARYYYPPNGVALPQIPVHGPAGTPDRIAAIGGPGIGAHAAEVYDFHPILPGKLELGPFTLDLAHVNHPIETFGMRVEHEGRSLCYSADTGPSDALVELARGADVFLCEASFLDSPDNPPDVHLSGRQAGEHATKAGAKELLLTHLVAGFVDPLAVVGEASVAFDGPVEHVRAGWSYEI